MKTIWMSLILINIFFVFPAIADNEAEKLLPSEFKTKLPEDFQSLTELRQKVMVHQNALKNELNKLNEERSYLQLSSYDIEGKIDSLKTRIAQDKIVLNDLVKKENLNAAESERLESLKYYIPEDERAIKRYEQESIRLNELNNQITSGNRKLSSINEYLDSVEQKIANLLNIEEERNAFRKLISFTFCGLVAIVIVGFYFIALRKENIAESIFSGEKGIQFVTIFLIVIAIILFGIMGILEGKELSALLGGLSGYILGRVSRQS